MSRSVRNGVVVVVPKGSTALHELCRGWNIGDCEVDLNRLQRYVGDSPRIARHELMARNEHGDVPIVKAIQCRGIDTVKFILNRAGSDSDRFEMLSSRNIFGGTPFMEAAHYAEKETIELFLQSVGTDENRQALKEQGAEITAFNFGRSYEVIKMVSPTPDPVGEFYSRTVYELRRMELDDLIGLYKLYHIYKLNHITHNKRYMERRYFTKMKDILRPVDDEENDDYWADTENWMFPFEMFMWFKHRVNLYVETHGEDW